MEKSKFLFFGRRVWISVGSRLIFGKALRFPVYPHFCRLNRIILSRLKKIKKNIEKSKIIFFRLLVWISLGSRAIC